MLDKAQLEQFYEDGYVIIPGINESVYDRVKAAAERATAKARDGVWPDVRVVGGDGPRDIWGVSNLLHPDLGEPAFADYLATDEVLETAGDLLPGPLRLSLTNMLVNPALRNHAIRWHRDTDEPGLSGEEELALLRKSMNHTQWNAAIHAESCLRIVPGSHTRNITDAERDILVNRPFEPMPGELKVHLQEGETVYYNALLLHKGDYPKDQRRLTLHAAIVLSCPDDMFGLHYDAVKFMEAPDFRSGLPAALHPLLDNWLAFAERVKASRA
jgi:hypothetical protein